MLVLVALLAPLLNTLIEGTGNGLLDSRVCGDHTKGEVPIILKRSKRLVTAATASFMSSKIETAKSVDLRLPLNPVRTACISVI